MINKDQILLAEAYSQIYLNEHNVKKEDAHKQKVRKEKEQQPSTPSQIDDDEDLKSKKSDDLNKEEEELNDETVSDDIDNNDDGIQEGKIKHGIQIYESQKSVSRKNNLNPWAITNKNKPNASKAEKEKEVKAIKKSARKYGKKITSKPVKKSK
jgi:hypothetical protein